MGEAKEVVVHLVSSLPRLRRGLGLTDIVHRFGTMALLLQLVPVLSMFFLLTTAAGSALWVADMEDRSRSEEGDGAVQPGFSDDP